MKSTVPTHYHYHSFPRRWRKGKECDEKGLEILASIVTSGFLLTPELVEWPGEFKKGARVASTLESYHKRACFTYLIPQELSRHAEAFGPFSIEFDNWQLRTLGGLPVIYVPLEAEYRGYLGAGIALASRVADFQALLERLKLFLELCEKFDDKTTAFIAAPSRDGGILVGPAKSGAKMIEFDRELLEAIKADKPEFEMKLSGPTALGGNIGCVQTLLRMLTWNIQSYDVQLGSVQALGGYFYPSERLGGDDLLTYYRQREWRILGSMTREGVSATRPPNAEERARLIQVDHEFFERPIPLRDGRKPAIADECVFLNNVDGKHVLEYTRRVVCPESAKSRVEALLSSSGFASLPVTTLESASP